jgi:hypothetical protein
MRSRAQPLSAPRICWLDIVKFFVSVEPLSDPTLDEGKLVVVGGTVLSTASGGMGPPGSGARRLRCARQQEAGRLLGERRDG